MLYILQQTNRKQVTHYLIREWSPAFEGYFFHLLSIYHFAFVNKWKKKQPVLLAVNKLIQRYIGVTSLKLKIEEL